MLTNPDRYELAAPNCVADDFGGEIVAINLESGRYFSLRGFAYAVWQDLIMGHSPRTIHDSLASIDASLANDTAIFVTDLERHGLIRPSVHAAVTGQPTMSAPLAQEGITPPAVEVFDDMVDLITADPIHEVDEQSGWPKRRENQR